MDSVHHENGVFAAVDEIQYRLGRVAGIWRLIFRTVCQGQTSLVCEPCFPTSSTLGCLSPRKTERPTAAVGVYKTI